MSDDSDQGLRLETRLIPWPSSISDRARSMLRQFHEGKLKGDAPYPPLTDKEAWRSYVRRVNENLLVNSPMYSASERPGIQSEACEIGGVPVYTATPSNLAKSLETKIFLELHGGGLIYLAGEGTRRGSLREAERLQVRTISIDYRVPPDSPYPCALDDCVAVYRAVLDQYDPGDVIVGGISAGGNLAAALMLRARDEGLALPAGCILLTPEIDLTETGDTFDTLAGLDPVLNERLTTQIALYAGDHDLRNPYLSPLFGDFAPGFPPTFLQSGTRDMFLSNAVRMHRKLRSAGIHAELHVWEGMPHGGFMGSPEDDEIAAEMKRFMAACWGQTTPS